MDKEQRIEALAAVLWKTQAVDVGAPKSVADARTLDAFREESHDTIANCEKLARAALEAMGPKDLVWSGGTVSFRSGGERGYLVEFDVRFGWGFWAPFNNYDDEPDQRCSSEQEAKDAASAHHHAALWAMTKLGETE